MSLIVIAEPNAATCERLLEAAASITGAELARVNSLEDVLDVVEERSVSVVVVGPSLIGELAFSLAGIVAAGGLTSTVLVAETVDATLLRTALRSDVSDVVGESDSIADIADAIGRALAAAERARLAARLNAGVTGNGPNGHLVTVFSAKGGVGKTAIATNLAVALAGLGQGSVALVDLDLELGDVAIVLGMKPERTIYDVTQVFDRLDSEMLEGFLEHHPSGLKVLMAPLKPEEAETITSAQVGQILDMLRSRFDYVIIDTCPSFSEGVLAAFDRSDGIYLVASTDVTAIKSARVALQKLAQLGYDQTLVKLVLNRSDNRLKLPIHEIEEAIGLSISCRVPSDIVVPRSQNKGVPVVTDSPRCEVARALVTMAKQTAQSKG